MANPSPPHDSGDRAPSRGKPSGGFLPSYVHPVDLAISAVILTICIALFVVTTTFDEVSDLLAQNIPPEFFPRLVLYFIGLLALFLPFEHIAHAKRGEDIDSDRSERIRLMPYLTAGLLILIVIAMPYIGALLTLVVVCILLPLLWGERRWRLILPFAILFPLAVAFVFNRILLVYFEPGMLNISL